MSCQDFGLYCSVKIKSRHGACIKKVKTNQIFILKKRFTLIFIDNFPKEEIRETILYFLIL